MGSETTAEQNNKVVRLTAWFLFVVLFSITLKTLDFMFMPLFVALLFCFALGIPLDFLERFHIPRWLRVVLVVLSLLAFFYLFGRLMLYNVIAFEKRLPEFEMKFWQYAMNVLETFDVSRDEAREAFDAFLGNLSQVGLEPVGNIVQKLGSSFFGFLGNIVWVMLFVLFMLAERGSIAERVSNAFGKDQAESILKIIDQINKSVQHYLGLKILVNFVTAVLVSVILFLLGVPFALMWGVLTFLLNFIPNIGSLVASIPPIAITLFHFGTLGKTLVVGLLLTIVQFVVGNFLEPKMMGRGLNLSPLVVLLALIFWGWMWGIVGMLLSVPLTAAIKIALDQIEATKPIATLISSEKDLRDSV